MVSEKHRFGGTPDIIAKIGKKQKLALLDLKTSNGVYPDHLVQLAAYEGLWLENGGEKLNGGLHLLRVGKKEASFHHHFWQSLPKGWQAFQCVLELHNLQKDLRRVV